MDLDKKLKSLPKELLLEVEQYVDFLLYKQEKTKTSAEPKQEKDIMAKTDIVLETPVIASPPPPLKEHKVLGLYNSSGPSNNVATILSKVSSTTKPTVEPQKAPNPGWDIPYPSKSPSPSNKSVTAPKTEMLGEREIETERKLYPCPHCAKVVQDNWESCPYCEKSLREPIESPKKAKK